MGAKRIREHWDHLRVSKGHTVRIPTCFADILNAEVGTHYELTYDCEKLVIEFGTGFRQTTFKNHSCCVSIRGKIDPGLYKFDIFEKERVIILWK